MEPLLTWQQHLLNGQKSIQSTIRIAAFFIVVIGGLCIGMLIKIDKHIVESYQIQKEENPEKVKESGRKSYIKITLKKEGKK